MPSITVENYLKRLYEQQQKQAPDDLVPVGRLAAAMGVTAGTGTSMVKALAEANLVRYEPRGGVRLTDAGTTLALAVLRRHRLIELFLVQVLGLDWSEVHDEAEELEHAISDKVLDRIDALLGHPDTDPHGDPIPAADGRPRNSHDLTALTDCPTDQPVTIARILDQDQAFLQFVDRQGLAPGAGVTVRARSLTADAVTLQRSGGPPLTLGNAAAAKIMVRSASSEAP
jgi:DtxR family Mn-dependent transcriptional regulator